MQCKIGIFKNSEKYVRVASMYDTDMAYPLAATFIIIYIPDDLVTDCIIDLQPSWHLFGKS